jgi:hypothetical protein
MEEAASFSSRLEVAQVVLVVHCKVLEDVALLTQEVPSVLEVAMVLPLQVGL